MGAMRFWFVLSCTCLAAAACGGAQVEPEQDLFEGDAKAPPSMQVLPEPDVKQSELSKRMQFAWRLAAESFGVSEPAPPKDASVQQLQKWSNTELEKWLEKKNERVEAARAELDAAAKESHRQRILAGALVGLMYEDVARVLLSVPVPDELKSEPDIAKIFRENVTFQAKPYLEHARRAYRACALNAKRPRTMRHWSGFCADRRTRLPLGDTGGQGETVVTVSVDEEE